MNLRRFFASQNPGRLELRYPSRLEEIFQPKKAEQMWAALEEAEEVIVFHEADEENRDREYLRYADRCEYGIQKGNPPDSRELDAEIQRAAERFPETVMRADAAAAEEMRIEHEADRQAEREEAARQAELRIITDPRLSEREPEYNPYDNWPRLTQWWPNPEASQ
jgi:hypothetical protein